MKINKKILGLSTLALLGATSLNTAQAMDFKARAGVGFAFYELETPQIYGVINGTNTSLNVGLTAGFGPMYIDAKIDTTISGEHNTFASIAADWFYSNDPNSVPSREDLERDETTITFGYSLSPATTVFIGTKSTETTLNAPAVGYTWEKDQFKTDGTFIGAAFGFPISDESSLSMSLAVAALDGDYTDSTFLAMTGDTTGLSFGLNYNLYLSDTSGIAASWSYQEYVYDMGPDTLTFSTTAQEITEKYSNFGVSYFIGF